MVRSGRVGSDAIVVREAARSRMEEGALDLRTDRTPVEFVGRDRHGAEATERVPHHVALVRRCLDRQFQKAQRLLVGVEALGAHAFESLLAANSGLAPDVVHAELAVKLGPHPAPLARRHRALAVDAEVGTPRGITLRVDELCHRSERLGRRVVPDVIAREVLPRRRVLHAADLVREVPRQARPLPFVAQPLLHRETLAVRAKRRGLDVLDADLRHDRELAQGLRVRVARDVPHALVPDVAGHVLPPELHQYRMDRCPPDLSVPEPERRQRRCLRAPRLDVRPVPLCETGVRRRVAGEPRDAVRTVGDDADGLRPLRIELQRVVVVERDPVASVGGSLARVLRREAWARREGQVFGPTCAMRAVGHRERHASLLVGDGSDCIERQRSLSTIILLRHPRWRWWS